MRRYIVLALMSVLFLGACDDPTGSGRSANRMTAQVNGAAWSGSMERSAAVISGVLTIRGVSNTEVAVTLFLPGALATGTYSLAPDNPRGAFATVTFGGGIWSTALEGGSGTLVITAIETGRITGTFLFVGVPANSVAAGNYGVGSGSFDLEIVD